MGRREIPVERVAVEVAAEPALAVAGAGRGLGHSIGHRRFSCLTAVYPPASRKRNARTQGGAGKAAAFFGNPRCWPRGFALICRRFRLVGAAGLDQTVAEEARPAVAVPRRGLVLMAALMAIFMPAVESSIVATAMPTIIGHLGGFHLFSWVFAVPFLTMAVTIPLYGRLADIYGRRRVFFIGTAIFLIGTTLCGFARSMELLILFRAIQGIGSGAIQPIAMTIIGDIYTPAERARIQGAMSACGALPRSSGRRPARFWSRPCTGRWCSG